MGRLRNLGHGFVILLLVSTVAWQWQVANADPTKDAFQNADRRLRGEADGERDRQGIGFEVPRGTQALRIGSVVDLDGKATFTLVEPDGTRHVESLEGDTKATNCCWKKILRPAAGEWYLEVQLKAEGAYAFGFYFEEEA